MAASMPTEMPYVSVVGIIPFLSLLFSLYYPLGGAYLRTERVCVRG